MQELANNVHCCKRQIFFIKWDSKRSKLYEHVSMMQKHRNVLLETISLSDETLNRGPVSV